jgi:multidrug efflux pump
LLLSQVLTLYTTPVIYLFFDRLAAKFSRSRASDQSTDGVVVPEPA